MSSEATKGEKGEMREPGVTLAAAMGELEVQLQELAGCTKELVERCCAGVDTASGPSPRVREGKKEDDRSLAGQVVHVTQMHTGMVEMGVACIRQVNQVLARMELGSGYKVTVE